MKAKDQLRVVFESFYKSPKTMKEADKDCGIMRENICRYVEMLMKAGRIAVIRKKFCTVTRHLANEYTTNPKLFPSPSQFELFT